MASTKWGKSSRQVIDFSVPIWLEGLQDGQGVRKEDNFEGSMSAGFNMKEIFDSLQSLLKPWNCFISSILFKTWQELVHCLFIGESEDFPPFFADQEQQSGAWWCFFYLTGGHNFVYWSPVFDGISSPVVDERKGSLRWVVAYTKLCRLKSLCFGFFFQVLAKI